jgi:hypothetical protein
MVNNAINIHRTNNHLSPQIIEHTHTKKKDIWHVVLDIQIQTWVRHKQKWWG